MGGVIAGGDVTLENVVVGCIGGSAARLLQKVGFTPERVAKLAQDIINRL